MILNKEKIKVLMQSRGIKTQKELAELMNISKNQLSLILSDKYTPIKSNIHSLCKILDVNIVEILHDRKDINSKNNNGKLKKESLIDVTNIKPKKNFNVLELFAGAGGLALGLEKSGFNTVGLIEIDKSACQTLNVNRPNWNIIDEDIIKVAEKGIKNYIDSNIEVDLLSGGYPCQAFSYAGMKRGLDDVRGTMFYYYASILNDLLPKMFLAENVRGLVSHDNGQTLKTMIDVFENIGYNVSTKILSSWDYGVAQKRERIVIIGVRKDLDIIYEYPKPYSYKPVLRDVLLNVPVSVGSSYPEKKKKILDLVPPGGCWRDLPEEIAKTYMGKSFYSGGGRTGMARRISWEEPCLTLTCSPSQKQTERCHPEETRPFTTREYARIQSFPDDWQFVGSVTNIYKQIGNAVPVNLAKAIGLSIINSLNKTT